MTPNTVYLIDDEPELVELLSDVIELAGLHPQGYTQARLFFEQMTEFKHQAVLVLDLHMPDLDGIEVMRKLAEIKNPPALILISGHDSGVLHAAEKLGRIHHLEILASLDKPIMLDRFQQLLEQFYSKQQKSQQNTIKTGVRELTASELRQAIPAGQLLLHYQPQININTGKLIGVEALVRWQHPLFGLLGPDHFIPLAERSGTIEALTHWIIAKVVQQKQEWQNAGLQPTVSVNISAIDITSLTLPEHLSELLEDNKLDPLMLILEVTESALMGELATSLDILTRLRLKGIGLSIDDFGTGYSSLSQLHRIPFTELKIDRSFISHISDDSEARAIVKTCIMLGHELNMQIVAEGVETQEHMDLLQQLGCDIAQGYFISKPVPAEQITERWA